MIYLVTPLVYPIPLADGVQEIQGNQCGEGGRLKSPTDLDLTVFSCSGLECNFQKIVAQDWYKSV